jgi:lantibiotic immunity protein
MVGREVKTVNKKCLFAVVIVLVSLICLSACGALRDTADKNKALNESLPYYELNAANYDEISYNGLTYTITDECLEMSELQEEIGQVSKRFKNVAPKAQIIRKPSLPIYVAMRDGIVPNKS